MQRFPADGDDGIEFFDLDSNPVLQIRLGRVAEVLGDAVANRIGRILAGHRQIVLAVDKAGNFMFMGEFGDLAFNEIRMRLFDDEDMIFCP